MPRAEPQPPVSRPTWVLVLGSMMLLAGGRSLIAGMLTLRDPAAALDVMASDETVGSDQEMQLGRQLAAARLATVTPRRSAIRAVAVAEVLLSLFALYATAAVLSRDRHGRALALALGGLIIAYRLATLPVYLSLMRDFATRGADDLLALAILRNASGPSWIKGADLAQRVRSVMMSEPIVVAVGGIAGALVLLGFFGGRRGRALYGLDGAPRRPPLPPPPR
jgi:hypothetical protein